MPDRLDTVITDGSLRRLAREQSDATAPVLIELAGPTEDVEVRIGRGGATFRPSTVTIAASTGAPAPDAEQAVTRILGSKPRYLNAARAFAAVATGAQLAALAANPIVAAIRPDRVLKLR
jgi:hypothetical protein